MGGHASRMKNHRDVEIVSLCDVTKEAVENFFLKNLEDTPHKPAFFTSPKDIMYSVCAKPHYSI